MTDAALANFRRRLRYMGTFLQTIESVHQSLVNATDPGSLEDRRLRKEADQIASMREELDALVQIYKEVRLHAPEATDA